MGLQRNVKAHFIGKLTNKLVYLKKKKKKRMCKTQAVEYGPPNGRPTRARVPSNLITIPDCFFVKSLHGRNI